MELDLAPLNLPSDNERPFVIAGPCSAETKMLVATEVATPEHVELALKYGIDILWIGARTSANPFAMQAIADSLKGVDVPVFVKNPVNPDIELWIGALERINQAGIKRWVPSIAASPATSRRSTVMRRCGRFPSSCAVVSLNCR